MRLFVAVTPGVRFVQELTLRLDHLRGLLPLAWVRPVNWHLTLQFLGDWPESRTRELALALSPLAGRPVFDLAPGQLGAFPNRKAPRALFLQLGDGEPLADLAAGIREQVNGVWPDGPQDNRRFQAHLTVARVGKAHVRDDFSSLWNMDLSDLPASPVTGFSLFVSELRPEGVKYRERAFYPLRKKGE